MVEKMAAAYRKAQMGIASSLAGTTGSILDETAFYDAGYMDAQVKRVQKEISSVTKELEVNIDLKDSSEYGIKKKRELMKRRERLVFRLVFLASNSFKNLDDCVKIAEGHKYSFMKCVEGLLAYDRGQKEKAFSILEKYYKEHKSVEGHFLINKVFGMLLAERDRAGRQYRF
ncbi:hypothetical protein C823_005679 [Eubacterium plexicaudatum ASF492]|nr:hypothetical protein C823_005679 [Eubacterium plexicaudatum ASF492]